jgi:hypothetical protein
MNDEKDENDLLPIVEFVYSFETNDNAEESAVACIVGGDGIYRAIKVLQKSGKTPRETADFLRRLNDSFNIIGLIGGGL